MSLTTATVFYLLNSTTVDTGTGIDVRFLSDTASSLDTTQTATATHTQDNVERTFDPATTGVTAANDSTTLQKLGWGLRVTNDVTPTDDTNCNAVLPAGTMTVNFSMALGWTGTPLGNSTPIGKASIFRYNPTTDSGTLIASGQTTFAAWNALTENNAVKSVAISIVVGSNTELLQGETLLLQLGVNTGTLGNPLTGTITYTFTPQLGTSGTNVTLASGQDIAQVCYMTASSSGVATPSGSGALVIPTSGSSSGTGTVSGTFVATGVMAGSSSGVAAASGSFGAVGETTGSSSGTATVSGSTAMVAPTVGTVDIGGGGGTTTYIRPTIIFDD